MLPSAPSRQSNGDAGTPPRQSKRRGWDAYLHQRPVGHWETVRAAVTWATPRAGARKDTLAMAGFVPVRECKRGAAGIKRRMANSMRTGFG